MNEQQWGQEHRDEAWGDTENQNGNNPQNNNASSDQNDVHNGQTAQNNGQWGAGTQGDTQPTTAFPPQGFNGPPPNGQFNYPPMPGNQPWPGNQPQTVNQPWPGNQAQYGNQPGPGPVEYPAAVNQPWSGNQPQQGNQPWPPNQPWPENQPPATVFAARTVSSRTTTTRSTADATEGRRRQTSLSIPTPVDRASYVRRSIWLGTPPLLGRRS